MPISNSPLWQPLRSALDLWHDQGRIAEFWLRDDDAVEPTAALSRLCGLSQRFSAPLLLAVIPKNAGKALAQALADYPLTSPCQHGYRHRNHAPIGERAQELGLHRPKAEVLAELAQGRHTLQTLFPHSLSHALVPPWNRMAEALLPELPALGFNAVSRFGPAPEVATPGICAINANLDIIDWRNGRCGRSHEELIRKLGEALQEASAAQTPIGVLAHHLVHDETAWTFLDHLMQMVNAHPAARWRAFDDLRY